MSVQRHSCFTLACDACRSPFEEREEQILPHFDTTDAAIAHAVEAGWHLDEDGNLYCDRCIAIATCVAEGHDLTPWMPCVCRGEHPDHALWGCGLLRYCERPGCDHAEQATLASLPTTDEPTSFGR